jgi:copper(I)-binding protein
MEGNDVMRRMVVAVAALLSAGACSSDSTSTAPADASGTVQVTDAWARSSMPDVGAIYFTVTDGTGEGDRLVGVDVGDVAEMASIHETTVTNGMAEMHPVDGVDVPAGGTVTFEPGGYHVMLEQLSAPLQVGSRLDLVLTFEKAGEVPVSAEVREFVADDPMASASASGGM